MLNITNYYEQLVIDQLWKLTEESDEQFSQGFLEDVACLALNKLPACYVRNPVDKGSYLTDLHYLEMTETIGKVIAAAMEQVRLRPHDIREV